MRIGSTRGRGGVREVLVSYVSERAEVAATHELHTTAQIISNVRPLAAQPAPTHPHTATHQVLMIS